MIAMAIALDPAVLIADEPTTALDVTVQAQIMRLLQDLQDERKMGLILITHDLGVVADVADRIAVMYAGRIVEQSEIFELYASRPTRTPRVCSSRSRGWTRRAEAGRHRRPAAEPEPDPAGLPVQSALSLRAGRLPGRPPPPLREVVHGRLSACHFSELLLQDSPKLEVTQTADDVEAAIEFGSRGCSRPSDGTRPDRRPDPERPNGGDATDEPAR